MLELAGFVDDESCVGHSNDRVSWLGDGKGRGSTAGPNLVDNHVGGKFIQSIRQELPFFGGWEFSHKCSSFND